MKERYALIVMSCCIIDPGMWFQTWECGIRLCKELSTLYEKELFDYHKLAAILVSVFITIMIAHSNIATCNTVITILGN